jgi:hypothetical protein
MKSAALVCYSVSPLSIWSASTWRSLVKLCSGRFLGFLILNHGLSGFPYQHHDKDGGNWVSGPSPFGPCAVDA